MGMEFSDSELGGLTISALAQRGVLTAFALNDPKTLRFEPPAIITAGQVDEAVHATSQALAQTAAILEM